MSFQSRDTQITSFDPLESFDDWLKNAATVLGKVSAVLIETGLTQNSAEADAQMLNLMPSVDALSSQFRTLVLSGLIPSNRSECDTPLGATATTPSARRTRHGASKQGSAVTQEEFDEYVQEFTVRPRRRHTQPKSFDDVDIFPL